MEDLNLLCSILLTTIGKVLIFSLFEFILPTEILKSFMVTASPHSHHKCLFTIISGLAHIVQKFPLVDHNSKMAAAVEFPFSYGKPELSAPHGNGRIDPSIFWSRGRKRTTFRIISGFILFLPSQPIGYFCFCANGAASLVAKLGQILIRILPEFPANCCLQICIYSTSRDFLRKSGDSAFSGVSSRHFLSD
jgi:hypothetical protein